MNDASDEDIMMNVGLWLHAYEARFGVDDLLSMLNEMIETLERGDDAPEVPVQ